MTNERLYRFFCDSCGYNRWSDGSDVTDLTPYKRSPMPVGIPKYDPVTKKITTKNPMNFAKQFKCPGCGRVISAKKQKSKKDEENKDTGS